MNEQAWQWAESMAHWLLAWTVVIVAIAVWLRLAKVRRASVRYAGWLVGTFAGLALFPVAMELSPVVSWHQAVSQVAGERVADADLFGEWSFLLGWDQQIASSENHSTLAGPVTNDARQPTARVPLSIASMIITAWISGLVLSLLRLLRAATQVQRLVAQADLPVPPNLRKQFEATVGEVGISRTVRLKVHPQIVSPMCTGILRPTILWPVEANEQMNSQERGAEGLGRQHRAGRGQGR